MPVQRLHPVKSRAVTGKYGLCGHLSRGQRAGLVGKQDVHASGGLNAGQPPNQNMVAHHAQHIGGQHNSYHHRQTFRHGDNEHGHCQRDGVQDVLQDRDEALLDAVLHDETQKQV